VPKLIIAAFDSVEESGFGEKRQWMRYGTVSFVAKPQASVFSDRV
jgi:hypothetical protein